nr:AAA family ATPase [Rhodospirillum rubrum]
MIKSIKLTNILSFGEAAETIELRPLTVVIGPNGSGKSNLIAAIELFRALPKDAPAFFRREGGIHDWLWKGGESLPVAAIEAAFDEKGPLGGLRYALRFTVVGQHFEIIEERIGDANDQTSPPYHFKDGRGALRSRLRDEGGSLKVSSLVQTLPTGEIDPTQSILVQRKDPHQYPELTSLGAVLPTMRCYREWTMGPQSPPRQDQKTDLRNDYLDPYGAGNLALVLQRLGNKPALKKRFLEALRLLYEGIDDYGVTIEGGTSQIFFHEGGRFTIPATRLSDGTLRYLCLLAILLDPAPPPLLCIEEPELGLHPDILPTLADLLKEASERTQVIVTTHSDGLVDAMTDRPEAVLIAEKNETGTTLTRLDGETLKPWLAKYRLGELWIRGGIGGTRW